MPYQNIGPFLNKDTHINGLIVVIQTYSNFPLNFSKISASNWDLGSFLQEWKSNTRKHLK